MRRLATLAAAAALALQPGACGGSDSDGRGKSPAASIRVAPTAVATARRHIRADLAKAFDAANDSNYPGGRPDLRVKCPERAQRDRSDLRLNCQAQLWLGDTAQLPVAADPYTVVLRGDRVARAKPRTVTIDAFFNADAVNNCSGRSLAADQAGDSSAALDALNPCL